MWIGLIVIAVALIGVWWWTVARDRFVCPSCGHPISKHQRQQLTPGPNYCVLCRQECH